MDAAIATKNFLVAAGLGTFGAGEFGIFLGAPPDKPDSIILINMTGGRSPLPHLLLNFPSVQIMVRGGRNGYVAASNKVTAVVNALLGKTSTVDGGDTYRAFNQIGDITYLGQDDNTRPMFSANFSYIVEPAAISGGHRAPIT